MAVEQEGRLVAVTEQTIVDTGRFDPSLYLKGT